MAVFDGQGGRVAGRDVAGLTQVSDAHVFGLAGGGFVVAWDGLASGVSQIGYQVYGADGSLKVAGDPAGGSGLTGFALPDGGFQLNWTQGGAAHAAVFDASGAGAARAPLAQPVTFAHGAGGAYLQLQDNQLVYFDGATFSPAQTLPGEAAHAITSGAVGALGDGRMAVTWTDAAGARVALYDPASHSLSPPTLIDAGGSNQAAIVALPDGGFAVSWTEGGQQKGEAFGPHGELGPSLYLDGSVAGVTAGGKLATVNQAAGGALVEQHYALSYAPAAPAAPVYLNYLGQAMAQSANPLDDITHSLHGPPGGGAILQAPLPGPSGVAASGGNNTIIASNGDNSYWLGASDKVVVPEGVTGTKTIYAWNAEVLPAGVNNLVFYGAGNWGIGNALDNLIVMGGNDVNYMDGGAGNDVLVGGFGKNTFGVDAGNGSDVIYNFHTWQDAVRFTGAGFTTFAQVQGAMTQVGADVVLRLDPSETLTFRGVKVSDFAAQNFLLPLDSAKLGGLTFHDEFDDLQLLNTSDGSGHWRTNFGGDPNSISNYTIVSNQEAQVYTDAGFRGTADHALGYDPFSIDGGVLTITAQRFTYADSQYTFGRAYSSGMLDTKGLFAQQYGYFEMKAQLPTTLGTWPALWLGQDPFAPGVEADVLEHLAMYPNTAFARANDNGWVQGVGYYMPDPSGYHTYGMLWTPSNTTFYVDGIATLQLATPASWDKPMYMILNLALGGWGGPIDQNGLPAHMNVDYVRVYGLADGSQVVKDMTSDNGYVSIGEETYTAPAGVKTITLVGSHQTVTGNDLGDTFVSNNTGNAMVGGAGADTFLLGRGGDVAAGGAGADRFVFGETPWAGAHVVDFAGQDLIDLSGLLARSGYKGDDPVGAGYIRITNDAAGHTQIWSDLDPLSPGAGWWLVATLDNTGAANVHMQGATVVSGGSGSAQGGPGQSVSTSASSYTAPGGVVSITLTGSAQTVTGNGAGDVFVSNNTGNHLIGGAGADTFHIGRGGDAVTGGGGADVFAFKETPWSGAVVADFAPSQDKLDLTGLLAKSGYQGADAVADGYIRISAAGSGVAQVWSNLDYVSPGAGWWLVATLEGVSPSSIHLHGAFVSG